uniref:Galectin n=1 Tax=Globodera rostochiensis TaxID=31243 RepID=A0A914H491_GLORO
MSFIHFLLVILITCAPLLHLADGQHTPTTPIHLTGNNQTSTVNIFYNDLLQCMPSYTGNNAEAYGLEFRLPRDAGHCDDGILICYPSTLGTSRMLVMSGQFRIPNTEQMLFVEECKALVTAENDKCARKFHWRGIKVYTMPPINGIRTHQIMLEASIASRPYNFGNVHQIGVHFGDRDQIATYATVEYGKQAYIDDQLLREAFLEKIVHGERLKNYAGLWVLGMDMLPSTQLNKLHHLYINRTCTCTMEAWFIRPTDSVAKIVEPETPIAGSKKCPSLNTNRTFMIGLIDADEQAIVIDALTDVDLKNMTVELSKTDENNVTGGPVLMNFTIGTTDELKVFLPETALIVTKDERLPNGSYKMHMEIILFKHFYAIKLFINGTQLGGIFLSKNWFRGIEWKNRSIKLTLNGQMMLFDEPKVTEINDPVKSILEKSPVGLPTSFTIDGHQNNLNFLFRFQKRNSQTTSTFSIMFSKVKRPIKEPIPGTAFIIQFELQDNCYNVTLKVYDAGKRTFDEEENATRICNKSNAFEFRFVIKHVMLDGNVNLLEQHFMSSADAVKKAKFVYALNNTLLNYGDKIILRGTLNPISDIIKIYLQNKDERCSKIYSNVAVLVFEINSYNPIICWHHLRKEAAAGLTPNVVISGKHQIFMRPYAETTLQILMAKDGFYGEVCGNVWNKLCPYYNPKNINISTMPIPPWTIDHITVNSSAFDTLKIWVEKASSNANDLFLYGEEHGTNFVPWKRINFTQVIKKGAAPGYVVFVNIAFKKGLKPDSEVRINFFNEALEFHDLFGATVFRVTLRKNTLWFKSVIKQNNSFIYDVDRKMGAYNDVTTTSLNSTIDQEKLLPLNLSFKIFITETDGKAEFEVTLDGLGKIASNHGGLKFSFPPNVYVPVIQYITVEYGNVTLAAGSAELEMLCSENVYCFNNQ